VPAVSVTLDEALNLARTGDVWLFRGRKAADRAIQVATNSPVNHVGMSVVIGDLPPLMWHAELGRSLPDLWSGTRHRGVQLHDLREVVIVWSARYGQRAWLRQLDRLVTSEMEDAVLRTVARMDGTPFPSTARLVSRWLSGRVPPVRRQAGDAELETAYCAEVLAVTYRAMGLLPGGHGPGWYDAGRFWSGDHLRLSDGFMLGGEIAVHVPPGPPRSPDVGGLCGVGDLSWCWHRGGPEAVTGACRVLLAGEEGAELLDRAHQRGGEHHGGVLVDADLDQALQVPQLQR
jgi:hypothetical protein